MMCSGMWRRFFMLWLAILIWLSSGPLSAQVPYFRKIPMSRELSRKSVANMYQDHQGFMWLGTEHGLYKYDGINYQPFMLPDSVPSNDVSAIYQDHSEQL